MTFTFYKYTGRELEVNKRAALAGAVSKSITTVKVTGNQDVEAPVLVVTFAGDADVNDYNYVYIQDWTRYYFVRAKTWLADSVWELRLEEDYLNTWAVAMANANYYGIARYSGLGDKNLVDPRVVFQPAPSFTKYPIYFQNTTQVPLNYWYCVKFMSTEPFTANAPATVNNNNIINVAIMNEAAYEKFVAAYQALTEVNRVAAAACIINVVRVRYIAPDSSAMSTYAVTGIRLNSPFSSSAIDITWTAGGDATAFIIPDPEIVADIFPRPCYVTTSGSTLAYFNTSGVFYELHSQYLLKLPELNPIMIDPAAYGMTTNFTIDFSISYEPFSEQYVIDLFGSNSTDRGPMPPIVQKAAINIPFLSDKSLDMLDSKAVVNTLGMIGGVTGGLGSGIVGMATGNVVAIGEGLGSITTSVINYDMKMKQDAVTQFAGMGVSTSMSGSPDWVACGYPNDSDACLYKITQQPVRTYWDYRGIPDNNFRSVLGLIGSGYAEIDMHDMPMLSGQTLSERDRIVQLMASGVYF